MKYLPVILFLPLLQTSSTQIGSEALNTIVTGGDQVSRGILDIFAPPSSSSSSSGGQSTTRCGQSYPVDRNSSYTLQPLFYGSIFAYPPLFPCSNDFLGTNGCNPIVNCSEFNLVNSPNNCGKDYLEISDGLNSSQRFCGSSGPVNTTSGISILRVKFQSGMPSAFKTYKCSVTCSLVSDSNAGSSVNVISSPPSRPNTITNCTCGIPGPGTPGTGSVSRIVGGETAPNNFWKWQTAIVFTGRTSPFCGGALINDRHVLTAAHCVVTTGIAAMPTMAQVVFNEYNTSTTTDGPTVRRSISSIVYHPFYNMQTQDYDVAVIKFTPPLNLASNADPTQTPVCLPPRGTQNTYAAANGTVIGWGTLSEGGSQPSTLQQASIPIISNDDCNKAYNNGITPRMICAQYPNGGVDSCQGDSGGPFMLGGTTESKYTEIGVVSFGEGCARADKPGVYSRVTDLNDWIRQTAWNATWCQE